MKVLFDRLLKNGSLREERDPVEIGHSEG